MKKRLYRVRNGRVFGGVCSGIGEYFDVDPTLIRLLWVAFCFLGCGSGLLAYIIAIFVMPDETHIIE